MATDSTLSTRLPDGAELTLRVPSTRDVESLILLPHLRTAARLGVVRPLLFKKMVASVDGTPATFAQANAWAGSETIAPLLLPRLRELLEGGRADGVAHARCPACLSWEKELPLPALAAALGVALPALFDGEWLAIPSLAQPLRRGYRPGGVALTARLRLTFPSARRGLASPLREGIVSDIEPVNRAVPGAAPLMPGPREAAAWARWAPDDVPRPKGFEHWRHELPAFQAVLRVALALDPAGVGDPAGVEELPAIDFYAIDALYFLTHAVDVNDAERVAVRCELCGARFLPAR